MCEKLYLGEEDPPEVAKTMENVAVIYQHLGNYKEAFALSQRAFNINEKKLGLKHPVVAQNMSTLGGAMYFNGQTRRRVGIL